MNEQHGWRQVSGHCSFSFCPKHSKEGHCKGDEDRQLLFIGLTTQLIGEKKGLVPQ